VAVAAALAGVVAAEVGLVTTVVIPVGVVAGTTAAVVVRPTGGTLAAVVEPPTEAGGAAEALPETDDATAPVKQLVSPLGLGRMVTMADAARLPVLSLQVSVIS